MKKCSVSIAVLIVGLCTLCIDGIAAPERRVALVIGNSAYETSRLKNPVNDATDLAACLKNLGFTVILKEDSRLQDMEEALDEFGNLLKRGGVGLFYFAGHGIQVNGINYLIPVGSRINRESDVKYQALDANKILDEMANANNGLNIIVLDACRDNPFAARFRNVSRGLSIISTAPRGTFVSYSTGPGQIAQDGDGRNSPYAAALLNYIQTPGLSIEQVFKLVRQRLGKETDGRQIPWELSSLEGDFYFNPGNTADKSLQLTTLSGQTRKGTSEKYPSVPTAEDRFIANANGTVLDTRSGLMWAAKDNGSDIDWQRAKRYCENYRGGGHRDWRMPKLDELSTLYDSSSEPRLSACAGMYIYVATRLIDISCNFTWASEKGDSRAACFGFQRGAGSQWTDLSQKEYMRALPVRSQK